MATPAGQAKAQALNMKMENEARSMIDSVEKDHLRIFGRNVHQCALKCYDQNYATTDQLHSCSKKCEIPHQQASHLIQQEINQFQNRINRSLEDCHDKARDVMVPGYENDMKKLQKVEDTLLACMAKNVDEHVKLLPSIKQRIVQQLKQIPSK